MNQTETQGQGAFDCKSLIIIEQYMQLILWKCQKQYELCGEVFHFIFFNISGTHATFSNIHKNFFFLWKIIKIKKTYDKIIKTEGA